jgi:hypothetical protein
LGVLRETSKVHGVVLIRAWVGCQRRANFAIRQVMIEDVQVVCGMDHVFAFINLRTVDILARMAVREDVKEARDPLHRPPFNFSVNLPRLHHRFSLKVCGLRRFIAIAIVDAGTVCAGGNLARGTVHHGLLSLTACFV